MSWDLPETISIRDVGPRDGLQPERPVPVADRLGLIAALVDAGVHDVEAAAFVSPRAVPAMAGAGDVFAALERDEHVRYWALVPNQKGAELAVAAGVDGITVTVSASEQYSAKNVKMTVADSVAQIGPIAEIAGGRPVDVVISCAFGSPFADESIGAFDVAAIVDQAQDAGASAITLADTTGVANPESIADVIATTGIDVRLHLHDTRGSALVNAFAAMQLGVTAFDTAVGGIGGSPFAPGSSGNLATEDLVHLCDGIGIDTGIDLDRLVATTGTVAGIIGRPVPSRVAAALGG